MRKPLFVTDPGLLPTESFNLLDKALPKRNPPRSRNIRNDTGNGVFAQAFVGRTN
jgi:hypothetical protein